MKKGVSKGEEGLARVSKGRPLLTPAYPCLPLLTLALALCLSACVTRTIVVESDPPGAQVWINERLVGPTPVEVEFITHGRHKFRLQKEGFRELTAREMVRAPIYQWIPLDLVFEYLLPFKLEDRHRFRYPLSPQPPGERLAPPEQRDPSQIRRRLDDPDPEQRRSACVVLATRRDPETVPTVLNATRDPAPIVRAAALGALRAIQGPQAIDRLLEALRQDPDREVRWQAATELEALGDPKVVPGLIEALKDKDSLVRAGAAEALKGIPDPQAVQPLIRALKDRDTAVRRAATEGLGRIGDRAAVPALTRALFHHDFQTRRRVVKSLAQLRDPASGPALVRTFTDWDPKVRQAAVEALIAFGDERVVPTLIRRLRGLKPWTRMHAAQVLGGFKDPRAVEPLIKAFRREPDPPASEAMLNALVALGAKMDPTWTDTLTFRFRQAEEKQKEQERRRTQP